MNAQWAHGGYSVVVGLLLVTLSLLVPVFPHMCVQTPGVLALNATDITEILFGVYDIDVPSHVRAVVESHPAAVATLTIIRTHPQDRALTQFTATAIVRRETSISYPYHALMQGYARVHR